MIQTAAYRLAEIQRKVSSSNNKGFLAKVHCHKSQVSVPEPIHNSLKLPQERRLCPVRILHRCSLDVNTTVENGGPYNVQKTDCKLHIPFL